MTLKELEKALSQTLDPPSLEWLTLSQNKLSSSEDLVNDFLLVSALATRKLKTNSPAGAIKIDKLPELVAAEAARILLTNTALENTSAEERSDFLWEFYRHGDDHEKAALMKGFYLIDSKAQHCDLAIHNGRTNNTELFAALALNNPYPCEHLDERALNQMLLKALFMDLDIGKVQNLRPRQNPTLTQLALDLVQERRAANRQPPPSIWFAVEFNRLNNAQCATFNEYLVSSTEAQRYGAAKALAAYGETLIPEALCNAVKTQCANESQETIKNYLSQIPLNESAQK